MENQITEQLSQTPLPQAPVGQAPKAATFPVWGLAVIAILIGGGALLTWQSLRTETTIVVTPTPTPTIVPSPTPVRTLSAIASQSAFLALEAQSASLSSVIRNFVTQDPSLNPPVLDLPLGF